MTVIKINIKTPCQEYEDREVEAQPDWSVRKIKLEIERCWSFHPRPEDQRLVYAGKLLQDQWILSDLLRQDEELNCHTMHLICRQTSFPSNNKETINTGGLRQRTHTNNHQSGSETERYQNLISSATTGASNSSNISTTTGYQDVSTNGTLPYNGPDQSNPWQMYINAQAMQGNQNSYLNQNPEQVGHFLFSIMSFDVSV